MSHQNVETLNRFAEPPEMPVGVHARKAVLKGPSSAAAREAVVYPLVRKLPHGLKERDFKYPPIALSGRAFHG